MKITNLYLSNNILKSLEGIEQFPFVKNLSLANNEVNFQFKQTLINID